MRTLDNGGELRIKRVGTPVISMDELLNPKIDIWRTDRRTDVNVRNNFTFRLVLDRSV